MERVLDFIGMFVGGWLGWMLGAVVSFFTAFMLGIVGTGVGLYVARRFGGSLLP